MKRLLLVLAVLMPFVLTPLGVQAADRELLLGTVQKGTILVVKKIEVETPKVNPSITCLQGSLQIDPEKPYSLQRYEFKQYVLANQPYRFRVVGDTFWGSCSAGARQFTDHVKRIPMEDMCFYDPTNTKSDEQYRKKYPDDKEDAEFRLAHYWSALPVNSVCARRPPAPGDVPQPPIDIPFRPTPGVFVDMYPTKDNKHLQLFILDVDHILLWNGTAKRSKGGNYWDMDWGDDEKEIERFPSPFKEAFTVFVRDKDYYFVTESGSVFLSREPGEKKERKVDKIWDGRRQPVHALITDASNDNVYCFVEPFFTDKQDEERVYFELAAKPEPTKYKLKKIEGVKIDDTLKSALEYAHVLRDDKRLK